jgi:hypothetical protein
MKILTEGDVLRIIQEEFGKKYDALTEELDMYFKPAKGAETEQIISAELKIKHKESGLRYTVDTVSPREVILRTPEGDLFPVSQSELEKSYELD